MVDEVGGLPHQMPAALVARLAGGFDDLPGFLDDFMPDRIYPCQE